MSIENFKPRLWASALEVPFKDALVFGQPGITDTRFQPMLQNGGRSVVINAIGDAKIREHDRDVDLTYDDISITDLELVMDQEWYFGFRVSDVDKVQAAGDFQSDATDDHGHKLATKVDSYLAQSLAKDAGTKLKTTPIFDGTDFYQPADGQTTAWDALRKVVTELNKNSAPTGGRWVVVGPDFAGALLADGRVTKADKAGTDRVARNGLVAELDILGLTVYQTNAIPRTAGRETIIAGVPGAMVAATQLYEIEALRDQKRFGDLVRGLEVAGAKVIRPKGVVTLEADVQPGKLPGGGKSNAAEADGGGAAA